MSVDHYVHYLPQSQQMSCWAASTAMMLGWRKNQCYSEETVLEEFRAFGTDGADEDECRKLAITLGMEVLPEACRTPEGWEQVLTRGPVMVGIPGHFIVVAGIQGDGQAATTQMHVLDPARGESWWSYDQVEQQYELDADFGYDLLQF